MFFQLQEQIVKTIQKAYTESKISRILAVSANAHDKIIYALVQQTIRNDLISRTRTGKSTKKAHLRIGLALFSFIFNSFWLVIDLSKYSLVPLLFQIIVKNNSEPLKKTCGFKLVFLNSAGGVDRLLKAIRGTFSKEKYVMYYLFTRFPRRIYQRSKNSRNTRFLEPHLPGRNAISGCLKFLLKNGQHFTSSLFISFGHFPFGIRVKVISEIVRYIYSLIIYHHWANKKAFELSTAHPSALFIFDLDEASKELMLSESLNKAGSKTLLLQHGILTDAKRYIPTCAYMACTSEREKRSLIREGVSEKRLFVTGQPLQTIKDSTIKPAGHKMSYPVLILAGVGPIWLQSLYVHMLRNSQWLKSNRLTYMRYHPAMRSKSKKLWKYSDDLTLTDTSESLGECIAKSGLVITFSIDALMVSVRQNRPTIVCIPDIFYIPDWHDFLLSLPAVKLVKSSMQLDDVLMDISFRDTGKNPLSEEQRQSVDYAFGSLNTKNEIKNLILRLSAEPIRFKNE